MTVSWEELLASIASCERCRLGASRRNVVPGEGSVSAKLMLIGEGPGANEDEQGRPFVGAAGELLTRMIEAIGMRREDCYIANVVKCRPPRNRAPEADEAEACLPYLRAQVALVKPMVIVLLGATAVRHTLGEGFRVTRDRGRFTERAGVFMMPTFHPAALLRDESKKRPAWEDFKAVRDRLYLLSQSQSV
ncbi:MAG: uracil-DNA glycosylase [Oscillospiraceae bacterium]|nr:uracil-DNA glycosylase [Oscillospiraceae bacterium]